MMTPVALMTGRSDTAKRCEVAGRASVSMAPATSRLVPRAPRSPRPQQPLPRRASAAAAERLARGVGPVLCLEALHPVSLTQEIDGRISRGDGMAPMVAPRCRPP
jgi:hypothetical protein